MLLSLSVGFFVIQQVGLEGIGNMRDLRTSSTETRFAGGNCSQEGKNVFGPWV